MKPKKPLHLVLGALAVAFTAGSIILVGCSKESPEGLPGNAQNVPAGQKLNSPMTAFYYTGFANTKAYIASVGGICEPNSSDGYINYFTANTGGGVTLVNDEKCRYTGITHSFMDCSVYVTNGDAINGGNSTLWKALSTGQLSSIAPLWTDANYNTPFYVDEIECDNSGNIFLLKKGDYPTLYEITATTLAGSPSNIVPTAVGKMFGKFGAGYAHESLCFNPGTGTMYLTAGQASNNTTVYSLNLSTAAASSVVTYNADYTANNISTYYYSGSIYLMQDNGSGSATLYRLGNPIVTVNSSMGAGPFHDMTYRGGICNQ